MADWLVEDGIGERRALLVDGDQVLAAKLYWPDELTAGQIRSAQLSSKNAGARRGLAVLEDGTEVLVDHLPSEVTEGANFKLQIWRSPIAERGRLKRAIGRHLSEKEAGNEERKTPLSSGRSVREFPAGSWEDVWQAASSGSLEFMGGEILCSVTPAMTLIDIDCGRTDEASFNAVPVIAKALRWFDLGGNIGIDFPSVSNKGDRKACDKRLGEYLSDWPHERTAMNGFGFVQIVSRLEGPSLLHRFAASRAAMCARYALRVAERAKGNGVTLELLVHPALKAKLKAQWLDELARRTGKQVRIETDPSLALESPSAQILAA